MDRNAKIGAGIAAGTAAFAAGLVIAFAAPAANSLTSASEVTPDSDDSSASAAPSQGQGRGYGHGAAALDEATTAKVKAAAESAVEGGTFKTARADGTGYVALVSKSDGTMMLVKMDADFQVSTVEEFTGGMGRGGMGRGTGETPLTGADAEKATAAAEAAVEGGTVLRVETDSDGTYEAHVRKADGTMVEVKMDADFKVTSVEEHTPGMGGRGGHHGGGFGPGGQPAPSASASASA